MIIRISECLLRHQSRGQKHNEHHGGDKKFNPKEATWCGKDRVVFGGGRGIYGRCSERCGRDGYQVIINYRSTRRRRKPKKKNRLPL
jgi:hypothetical protein